jgi:hypothetical protein
LTKNTLNFGIFLGISGKTPFILPETSPILKISGKTPFIFTSAGYIFSRASVLGLIICHSYQIN